MGIEGGRNMNVTWINAGWLPVALSVMGCSADAATAVRSDEKNLNAVAPAALHSTEVEVTHDGELGVTAQFAHDDRDVSVTIVLCSRPEESTAVDLGEDAEGCVSRVTYVEFPHQENEEFLDFFDHSFLEWDNDSGAVDVTLREEADEISFELEMTPGPSAFLISNVAEGTFTLSGNVIVDSLAP